MIYLTWLVLFIALPLLALWRWRAAAIWRQRRALAWTLVGAFILGGAWDRLAVEAQIWYYTPGHVSGLWLFGLPVEEWLWIAGTSLLFGSLTIALKTERL